MKKKKQQKPTTTTTKNTWRKPKPWLENWIFEVWISSVHTPNICVWHGVPFQKQERVFNPKQQCKLAA